MFCVKTFVALKLFKSCRYEKKNRTWFYCNTLFQIYLLSLEWLSKKMLVKFWKCIISVISLVTLGLTLENPSIYFHLLQCSTMYTKWINVFLTKAPFFLFQSINFYYQISGSSLIILLVWIFQSYSYAW